jgi:hypothetical protein
MDKFLESKFLGNKNEFTTNFSSSATNGKIDLLSEREERFFLNPKWVELFSNNRFLRFSSLVCTFFETKHANQTGKPC